MKYLQVLLIIAIALRYSNGELSELVNMKKLNNIGQSLNTDINPCDNFFEFACGNWEKKDDIDVEVSKELIKNLEEINFTNKPSFVKKAHDLYTSCISMDSDFAYGELYLQLMEMNEGIKWSVVPRSNETTYDWVHVLAVTLRYNLNDIFVKADIIDGANGGPTKLVLSVNKGLKQFPLLDSKKLMWLAELAPRKEYSVEDFEEKVKAFQEYLISIRRSLSWESEMTLVSAKEVKQPWLQRLISLIMESEKGDYELYLEHGEYFEYLDELLQEYDDRFLSMYLELQLLMKFHEKVPDFTESNCIDLTSSLMPLAVNYIYELNYPDLQDHFPIVQEVFNNIINRLNATISQDTKGLVSENFLRMVANAELKVGNLPRVNKEETLEKYYADLEVSSTDFNLNYISLLKFAFNIKRHYNPKDLAKNMDTFFDADAHFSASPYFVPSTEILVIPSYLLRQPLYHWGYDNVYQYSGLGMYITFALFSEMHYKNIPLTQAEYLAMVTLLHTPYKGYSYVASKELDETYPINDIVYNNKQIFYLNAAQFFCPHDDQLSSMLNNAVSFLPEFYEEFECKTYGYMKFFNSI